MPFGDYKGNKNFVKGTRIYDSVRSGSLNLRTPQDVLQYIMDNHEGNPKEVIYGFAAKSFLHGSERMTGKKLLQYLQDHGIKIHEDKKLIKMFETVHDIGEESLIGTAGMQISDVGNPEDEFDV